MLAWNMVLCYYVVDILILLEESHMTYDIESNSRRKLLEALFTKTDIEGLCSLGYELLGNPLHINDSSLFLISCAGPAPENEPIWNLIGRLGFPPSLSFFQGRTHIQLSEEEKRYIHYYPQMRTDYQLAIQTGRIIKVRSDAFSNRVMITPVIYKDKTVGSVFVLESERKFTTDDEKVLALFVKALGYYIHRERPTLQLAEDMASRLLHRLLDEDDLSAEIVRDRVRTNIPGLGSHMSILRIRFPYFPNHGDMEMILEQVRKILPKCIPHRYAEEIAILQHHNDMDIINPEQEEALCKVLKRFHCRAGVSLTYSDPVYTATAWKQCLLALEYGSRFFSRSSLHRYEQCLPLIVLSKVERQDILLAACDPGIIALMKSDLKNGSDYLQTFDCYLRNGGNLTLTSQQLQIHYNTLRFRLKKIEEITNSDLNDMSRFTLMYMTIHILQFTADSQYQLCMGGGVNVKG
jgi:hypothetical protein